MFAIVAVNVIAVWAGLSWNTAVPDEAGRAAPVVVVGTVGGTSCELVRLTKNRRTSAGDRLAEASRLSTYWSFVSVDGYFATNSGRVTKSLKYATLFASSTASAPAAPKTKPRCRAW